MEEAVRISLKQNSRKNTTAKKTKWVEEELRRSPQKRGEKTLKSAQKNRVTK